MWVSRKEYNETNQLLSNQAKEIGKLRLKLDLSKMENDLLDSRFSELNTRKFEDVWNSLEVKVLKQRVEELKEENERLKASQQDSFRVVDGEIFLNDKSELDWANAQLAVANVEKSFLSGENSALKNRNEVLEFKVKSLKEKLKKYKNGRKNS